MLNERPIGENLAELAKIAEEHLTDEDRLYAGTWVGMPKPSETRHWISGAWSQAPTTGSVS